MPCDLSVFQEDGILDPQDAREGFHFLLSAGGPLWNRPLKLSTSLLPEKISSIAQVVAVGFENERSFSG